MVILIIYKCELYLLNNLAIPKSPTFTRESLVRNTFCEQTTKITLTNIRIVSVVLTFQIKTQLLLQLILFNRQILLELFQVNFRNCQSRIINTQIPFLLPNQKHQNT